MRIAVVYSYLPTHMGGLETVMDALAVEYARRGHEVTAIGAEAPELTVRPPPTAYRTVGFPGINALEQAAGVPYPLPHPRMIPILRREVAEADVLFGHGFLSPATLAAMTIARARRRNSPVRVLMEHVGYIHYASPVLATAEKAAIQTIGRANARLTEGTIVCNTRVAAEMRALADRPVEWIPNGVDLAKYRPPEPGEKERLRRELGWDDRPRALFVGRLVAKKGVDILARVAEAGRGAFEVALVGPGALVAHAPNLRVLGPMPPDRVAELYRAADAFVLPSYGEGFPVTALEALASGCPTFLGRDATYDAWLDGVGLGAQQVSLDPGEIVAKLLALFADQQRQAQAAADSVAHVRRHFSWTRTAEAHLAFAERLGRTRTLA